MSEFAFTDPALAAAPAVPPVDGGAAGEAPATVLDALAAELAAGFDQETVDLPVPQRPGYEVRFSTWLPYEEFVALQIAARDPMMPMGLSLLTLYTGVVRSQARGLLRRGELVVEAGQALTFDSPTLQRHLGASDALDAVRRLYGSDGHVLKAGQAVAAKAGYGQGLDPTSA